MARLNDFSLFDAETAALAAEEFGTPLYIYDEALILERCRECMEMPESYGLIVRYAMKANSNRTILKLITDAGLHLDASSLNEVVRANLAGIPYDKIMLTTQETHSGEARVLLEKLLLGGLKYNACSLHQLELIGDFAAKNGTDVGIRIHPGIGSGESSTRNTGDDYSCFGIHLSDLPMAHRYAAEKSIIFKHIHVHIGSGADTKIWRQNIDLLLEIIEEHFPDADTVCFGGGLKEARMPDEYAADVPLLGSYAKMQIDAFYKRTGRKLKMEIEPGTYIVANSGYAVTRLIDMKKTSRSNFIVTDGGVEINSRPLLYGSKHPFYIISSDGARIISSEFDETKHDFEAVVAGKCCESGDCQTLDMDGHAIARAMVEPKINDLVIIGGVGAYCSSMSPFNYNSHPQVPEVLLTTDGKLKLIRKRQTLEQMLENEV
ncbi:MAG: diaminopimelate decarboxylase [Oscillospiraceae bacterium]|jgi:diaminopimelate decarboxylase|nr:diaminopimelate decarboxylase [Oscillospiraceae bacterium]